MRWLHLRGRESILKRLLVHASCLNFEVSMRAEAVIGRPCTLQGQRRYRSYRFVSGTYSPGSIALSDLLRAH